jgi:cyclopropane-fatty-acyl-phospholipid synthase
MYDIKSVLVELAEQGSLPDWLIRSGIRQLLKTRLKQVATGDCEINAALRQQFIEAMNKAPIAPLQEIANEQHYEVPSEFYALILGNHHKYSCCYWKNDSCSLEEAEADSLRMTCERAQVGNNMDILELGCGWGSLSLWIASHYPDCRITAVSNSRSQREFIEARARLDKLDNLVVITCDMNEYVADRQYDRVISIEMFEHMRNYHELLARINGWLESDGKFFMHIFCHRSTPYSYEVRDSFDWMSKYFFTGGIMPSDDLPKHFQDHLRCSSHWRWNGQHYAKTLEAWLENMDERQSAIIEILAHIYGADHSRRWWMRWRIFFIACAELFAYNNGQEWWVSHYLFEKREQQELPDQYTNFDEAHAA